MGCGSGASWGELRASLGVLARLGGVMGGVLGSCCGHLGSSWTPGVAQGIPRRLPTTHQAHARAPMPRLRHHDSGPMSHAGRLASTTAAPTMPAAAPKAPLQKGLGSLSRGQNLRLTFDFRPGAAHAGHARGGTQSGSAESVGIVSRGSYLEADIWFSPRRLPLWPCPWRHPKRLCSKGWDRSRAVKTGG